MKKPPRTRPEVEPLETLRLLATFSPLVAVAPAPSTATVSKPAITYSAPVGTSIATPTVSRPTISFGALNTNAATTPTQARLQVVGLSGAAGVYRAGQPPVFGSTKQPVVLGTAGHAGLPSQAQASRHLVVSGSGSTPTNTKTSGNTLHAMIVAAESKPVVIGSATHAAATPAPTPQAARLAVVGHGSAKIKVG
jgi:hypothetical protein